MSGPPIYLVGAGEGAQGKLAAVGVDRDQVVTEESVAEDPVHAGAGVVQDDGRVVQQSIPHLDRGDDCRRSPRAAAKCLELDRLPFRRRLQAGGGRGQDGCRPQAGGRPPDCQGATAAPLDDTSAGRDPGRIAVTTLLPTAVAQTRLEALDILRPGLAFYAGFFPRYNRMMAEHGFAEAAAAIAEAWSRGDRDAAERAVSDALVDATSIVGTQEECRERIEAYRQSGIDVPILSPYARGPGAVARFEAVIRACAPSP